MPTTQLRPRTWLWLVPVLVHGCGAASAPAPVVPFGPANRFVALEIRSQMSASFQIVRLRVLLDDAEVHLSGDVVGRERYSQPLRMPLCAARVMVPAGTHEVAVDVGLRGQGYGIFSYLSRYRFNTSSRARVDIPSNGFGAVVTGTVYETGGATTPLEDRPRVRLDVRVAYGPGEGCFP